MSAHRPIDLPRYLPRKDLVPRQRQDLHKASAPLLQLLLVVTPLMAILVVLVGFLIGSASAAPVSQGNTVRRHATRRQRVTSSRADGPDASFLEPMDDVDTSVHQDNLTSNTSVLSVLSENT
ncbi:unnamed protein product [Vitrella brassicaformis CCMP3155]|uniref:Transmembrane protein n=1 Tax=Vitrella brassicaformis (strain CCMP3155) TaxID=1169540 RepID=A0A0G4H881_VITBC|nr:unnamed protein product [Vitrella brassicaformis CCMP3155]|eukprot:CEM40021.1 unnamed protein product [Vitrella brassicaformis CCMP3155]